MASPHLPARMIGAYTYRMLRLQALTLLLGLLVACGGSGGGSGTTPSSTNAISSSSSIASSATSVSSDDTTSSEASSDDQISSASSLISSTVSSTQSSVIGGGVTSSVASVSSSSVVNSDASSSAVSSSVASSSSQPIFTVPDLVDVTTLNLIQDQLINIRLDNIGGDDLTECSSDLLEIFTIEISKDASTCVISGEASELIGLTSFTVTATNIHGSDTAQIPLQIQAATPFVTTWKTDNEGESDDNQITITTSPNFEYNYNIDWGDGSTNENITGDVTHTYAIPGEYQVAITGRFPQTFFDFFSNTADANKLLSVDAWGNRVWLSMEFAFAGAANLVINDNQAPDLSRVTSMLGTFASAVNFTGDVSLWDVSNVTDMTGLFFSAENFNGDLSGWDVSNVTSMEFMFSEALAFNSDISQWNVAKVTNMGSMFSNTVAFNQDVSHWDVANVTNMKEMFANAIAFNQDISSWNVAKVTDFESMFEDATAFNQNLSSWNISNALSIDYFAIDSGLSVANYDALLLGWSLLPLQKNLTIDVGSLQYTAAAEAARFILTDTFGWSVYDGGLLAPPDLQDKSLNAQTNNQLSISIKNNGGAPDTCTADTLPDGLSLQVANSTCEIIGTIATAQTTSFTVTATNDVGNSAALVELSVAEQTPFITRWKTDNPGMSDDNQITILTSPYFSYNYRVEWGDGSVNENVTGQIIHTYASPGEYTVSITGTFPQSFFGATSDPAQTDSQKLIAVEQWGNRTWLSMSQAFFNCRDLTINDTNAPDLSQVVDMGSMFANADNLSGNISNWDVSNVMFMGNMFSGADNFNLDISSWNVANVIQMANMFTNTKFNRDISSWNVSNVTNMGGMFRGVTEFNQAIGNWDVTKVNTMNEMFQGAAAFNQPIGNWNVAKVTSMTNMFRVASKFNQDISQWNTANVLSMSGMFREARAFNQDIGNWNVAKVSNMSDMFFAADAFNADISNWDIASLTNMSRMFRSAKAFDQNLGSWNVSNVTNMSELFLGGVLSWENYDDMLKGWSQLPSLKNGVDLNVGTTRFSSKAQAARDTLVNNFGWVITDGGLLPPP